MRPGAFRFQGKWMLTVKGLPESGMGFTVVSIWLLDGRQFNQAVIALGRLIRIRGLPDVPFSEDDISEIRVTHDKWDWDERP